ncbi:MAG: hypothetical protein ABI454_10100 [Sphingomicrobium sp.]
MLENGRALISVGDGTSRLLGAKDTASLVEILRDWKIPEGREEAVHDMARASLDQVKASTEYDDARALLTIVAFLTALAGAVFNRFSATYDLPRWYEIARNWNYVWPALTYAMFGAYAVIVAGSAFAVFGAMKPTFFQARNSCASRPQVVGFHERLIESHPHAWGQSFVDLTGDSASGPDNLKAHYAKHYILETYLVAEKVALKLKKAAPAVWWLQLSMLFLAGFILTYGVTLVFVAAHLGR